MARSRDRSKRIHAIVLPEQIPHDTAASGALVRYVEGAFVIRQSCLPTRRCRQNVPPVPRAAREHTFKCGIAAVRDNQAVARDGTHADDETGFLSRRDPEICRHDRIRDCSGPASRRVMHEIRTLVEECRIVFIGLDDEKRRLGQPCGNIKILRHTADQKSGIESGMFEYPRQHRTGRGLAVGSGPRPAPICLAAHARAATADPKHAAGRD